MRTLGLILFGLAVLGCGSGGRGPSQASADGSKTYYVDLRSVPLDQSNLAPGPHVLNFRAYAVKGPTRTWTDKLSAAVKGQIQAARGGAAPKFVPVAVAFAPVPGHPDIAEVAVTVDLDGPGTWQIDLPTSCYDYAAMGMHGPEALGRTAPLPAPPQAARPDAFGCVATAVMTVGSCPHVAYAYPVSAGKSQGTDIWRVVWSEAISGKVIAQPKLGGSKMIEAGGSAPCPAPSAAKEDASHTLITVTKDPKEEYNKWWKFDEEDGVASKFTYTFGECGVQAGDATIAASNVNGEPDVQPIRTVVRGRLAQMIAGAGLPPKTDAGSGE